MLSILAIQLKRIGDLVVTLPALEALRRANPSARISLIIDGDCAGLAPAIRCVDQVLVYRKSSLNMEVWRQLLFGRYQVALDFTGTDRSSALSWFSKAEKRIAFQWASKSQFRGSSYTQLVDSPVRDKHTVDHYLDLIGALGIPSPSAEIHLSLPKSARAKVREILRQHQIDTSYVVLHPGAARAEKYWRPERWAEIIDHCYQAWHRVCFLIGGSSEMEKKAIADILTHCQSPAIDVSGRLSLLASAALIEGADLLVGIDSGPSHLAAALKVPQVTLFGPTNPFHWRPRHDKALVLQGGKENPLTSFESHANPGDLNDLSTAEVIHAINLLLV